MIGLLAELIFVLLWLRTLVWAALAVGFHLRARRRMASSASKPDVAVVVPAFNEEDQIVATVSAIGHSDLTPAELIVVDDGSTDQTAELASGILGSTKGASLIHSMRNHGKAAALNTGFASVQSTLVASIDADTRLDPPALQAATERLVRTSAVAIAFDLQVELEGTFLSRIQAQEYRTSLNFERAGQAVAGAISVLPGAATLFRRDSLGDAPFRSRTLTEDADLTLELVLSGCHVDLETRAIARTAAPSDIRTLVRQRTRWAMGHMQCVYYHLLSARARGLRARMVYINFVLGTLSSLLATLGTACLAMFGSGPLLGLHWLEVVAITAIVIYLQRLLALFVRQSCVEPAVFFLEPIISGAVSTMSAYVGLAYLLIRYENNRRKTIDLTAIDIS